MRTQLYAIVNRRSHPIAHRFGILEKLGRLAGYLDYNGSQRERHKRRSLSGVSETLRPVTTVRDVADLIRSALSGYSSKSPTRMATLGGSVSSKGLCAGIWRSGQLAGI